jgi:hypothetical protein
MVDHDHSPHLVQIFPTPSSAKYPELLFPEIVDSGSTRSLLERARKKEGRDERPNANQAA